MVTLSGHCFVLRPYRKGDEASLQQHINDREIARNTLTIPHPYTLKDARTWIVSCLNDDKGKKLTRMVFALDINDSVVGSVGLDHIEHHHKAEIGYWLGRNYWGRGIMTEAVRLATAYAFSRLHLRRVYAYVFPFNKASAHVLEKNGYQYEGRLANHVLKNKKLMDDLLYAKIR